MVWHREHYSLARISTNGPPQAGQAGLGLIDGSRGLAWGLGSFGDGFFIDLTPCDHVPRRAQTAGRLNQSSPSTPSWW